MGVGLKHSHYWEGDIVPPTPPTPPAISHSPHDYRPVWRAADPRLRRLLLRGLLPEEFAATDMAELQELLDILDDLDQI